MHLLHPPGCGGWCRGDSCSGWPRADEQGPMRNFSQCAESCDAQSECLAACGGRTCTQSPILSAMRMHGATNPCDAAPFPRHVSSTEIGMHRTQTYLHAFDPGQQQHSRSAWVLCRRKPMLIPPLPSSCRALLRSWWGWQCTGRTSSWPGRSGANQPACAQCPVYSTRAAATFPL